MLNVSPAEAVGLCAEPVEGLGAGYFSPTLTDAFAALLVEAEHCFGARDKSWTPVGIVFRGERPQVVYPFQESGHKIIAIALPFFARTDPKRALFELAQEIVHLLGPTGGQDALVSRKGRRPFSHTMSLLRISLGSRCWTRSTRGPNSLSVS